MRPDPNKPQSITPNDVIQAVRETVENHPILYGLLPSRLVDDFLVKMIRRLYGWDFSEKI